MLPESRCVLVATPFANLASIAGALRAVGAGVELTSDPERIRSASRIVLPGVGSFAAAAGWLHERGLAQAVRDAIARGGVLLGICVGHQLLFETSEEATNPQATGLALLEGRVRSLRGSLPVPQIGWNRVFGSGGLFDGIESGTPFYFVNSFAARGCPAETAYADYGGPFTAAVQRDRVFGVQFHPEKSSGAGLRLLRNFISWT